MSGLAILALPLLAVGSPDGGSPLAGLSVSGDGGLLFEAAASTPLPTSCGPETEAAKGVARFREASHLVLPAADGGIDRAELQAFVAQTEAYQRESQDYRNEVQLLVQKRFDERRARLSDSYERAIRVLEGSERQERLTAIARFERFLGRYPEDPRFSADASFRLAELYYEKDQDDYNLAMDLFQQRLKDFQLGKIRQEPQQPNYDFSQAIALYRGMLVKFPDYRFSDAVYYLLGYCAEQMGAHDEADRVFAELIEHFPRSKFVPEAYLRQGESYFDTVASDPRQELLKAAAAYRKVLDFPDQPLYDKAIYKLGWTYYRLDDFPNAVDAFVKLLDFYRSKKGDEQQNDLEKEALQYTAICFADEKWGGVSKASAYFQQIGPRPYEKELYRRLGDIFYDQTKNDDAVASFKLALEKDPLAIDAPLIQAKIVQAYERDRAFDKQTVERERLVSTYGEGSVWAKANQGNADALLQARDLTEHALRDAAIYHLQQAVAYQKDRKIEQAFTEFKVAAQALGEYLQRYPRNKDVYELTFYHAEALYNSLQFLPAARAYQEVRDMTVDHQYERESAHDAVLAYQNEIEREQKQGLLKARPVLKSTDRKDNGVPKPERLPPIYVDLVRASDTFVNLYPKDSLAAAISYKAAEGFYVFNQFDEARCRFTDIITRYPRDEVAQYAANLTIETYLATKDWANVTAATAELLRAGNGVVQKGSELEKTLVKFHLAGIFKLAQQEMDAGHYDRAASLFIELVQNDPKNEFADKALNNAAVCYENVRRFDSALRTYERVINEYPGSALADQALFRVASDAEQSYDFDKAVSRYLQLVDRYPNSKNRAGALYNAARLLEGLQRYPEAAGAYKRYAELFPNEPDAPQNLFRAALINEKRKDYEGEIKAFQEFDKKFDRVKGQAELTVQARLKMAQAYQALGREKERSAQLKDTVAVYDRLHLGPDKPLAADAAAEAQFDLLEEQFQAYDKQKIYGSKKVLEKSFKDKASNAKKLRDEYAQLVRFKRPEWLLAAFYRKANVLEHFANSIYDAPIPPEIKRLGDEAIGIYQDALGQKATALEAQAADDYVKALDEARKLHIVNAWTKRTLESLSHYRPKEYPVLKEAKEELALEVRSPEPLAGLEPPPEAPAKAAAASAGGQGTKSGAAGPAPVAEQGKVSGDSK